MYKKYLLSSIIFVIIDYIYLSNVGNKYNDMIFKIQNKNINLKMNSAIVCYIILLFGLNYFIIKDNKSELDAFLLGFTIYGVYDATNHATIEEWNLNIAITDTIWGGLLFYSTTYLTYYFTNKN
tara:strand:- start:192 stop:563 length:372 start_codon:yes stop_codon:yes gene_type:complete